LLREVGSSSQYLRPHQFEGILENFFKGEKLLADCVDYYTSKDVVDINLASGADLYAVPKSSFNIEDENEN
jgi:hypothetical protein